MDASANWLVIAQRLQAIAQAGLAFEPSDYDRERYEEVHALSMQMFAGFSGEMPEVWQHRFATAQGYPTPKTDVRAVVFSGDRQILMVQERSDDDRWTLPGGWADVGYTPFEVAEKELREETGMLGKATRLLALLDKRKHAHPPQPWYCYKAFVLCQTFGGQLLAQTSETRGARFVERREIPQLRLSTDRVTSEQLQMLFRFAQDPTQVALCD
jgi:ADP-ribose pyrophosphatase YjhB (NUDIX family)